MSDVVNNQAAIVCEKISMSFPLEKVSLKQTLDFTVKRLLGNNVHSNEYVVFRDLSFAVNKGEVFGIIGRNGCGKTTLLKILSKVLVPKSGTAYLSGSVASLLSVGTGFHPAYTGLENIYFNGTLLGMSKSEIDNRLDAIVSFADIGEFIDRPVKTYSSGMQARLAFSIAAQLDADIIILDEILSVGDSNFREKCMKHMYKLKADKKTILLVSHNMGVIESFCDRALLIQSGSIKIVGNPLEVIQEYSKSLKSDSENYLDLHVSERTDREGSGELLITDFKLLNGAGVQIDKPVSGEDVVFSFTYVLQTDEIHDVDFGIAFFSETGAKLIRFGTEIIGGTFRELSRKGELMLKIQRFPFASGKYIIGFRGNQGNKVLDYIPNAFEIEVEAGDFFGTGVILDHSPIFYPHDWVANQHNWVATKAAKELNDRS